MIKRLLLVIGIIPVMAYSFFKWLFTGSNFEETVESFIAYCND